MKAGLVDVETEQSDANSEAERHIDKGRTDAEDEQKKGEDEAERVKKEKEKEFSGGFFGKLASMAKSFFEGLKQAISSVLDAARKAIKRVIEVAKKLAVQVIEAARKAIVATIKAVGKALIAIGDRLLAAFPALRERFRATIQGFVDQAVEAVNALAESLKENVQKALDLLGKGLDAALGLLEKGLHAIVDGVNSVVQGAISFAKGVVEALGAFAVLIKDIAGDPGGWLGKLGASVMDGIQNHLWGALKTAALGWFQSKVLELLGIGGIVVQLLMEGGIDLGQITNMAWEALQSAIPVALITILVEKLVSMIVPAAGAVIMKRRKGRARASRIARSPPIHTMRRRSPTARRRPIRTSRTGSVSTRRSGRCSPRSRVSCNAAYPGSGCGLSCRGPGAGGIGRDYLAAALHWKGRAQRGQGLQVGRWWPGSRVDDQSTGCSARDVPAAWHGVSCHGPGEARDHDWNQGTSARAAGA